MNRQEHYGGNLVTIPDSPVTASTVFAEGEYYYSLLNLADGETWRDPIAGSRTLFVLDASPGATVRVGDGYVLHKGDSLQAESQAGLEVKAHGGNVMLLASGADETSCTPGITHAPAGTHYKVSKPWGHEIWFTGEHPAYSFKEVCIRAGNRTSLQYHRFKRETNVLFHGQIALIFKSNEAVENDAVTGADLGRVVLSPVSAIDVTPGIIHRIESIKDVLLYEVSTPHLDDVIRVQDDRSRGHGRVHSEHRP